MILTPKQIVAYLDEYIIGQVDAKKTIALALRNRTRRMKLPLDLQEEIMPKNILMIGSTGVGKTEIARRLTKMMNLPFVKVEASKYTEVGFVGRDVESMVRDLMQASINLIKEEHKEKNSNLIDEKVEKKIIEKLLPPIPKGASEEKQLEYQRSYERMQQKVRAGDMDELKIEVQIEQNLSQDGLDSAHMPPELLKAQESFMQILGGKNKPLKKEMKVKEAKITLRNEASEQLLDMEAIKIEAKQRCEQGGIIFIDEIDKIAVSSKSQSRQDPSKEGVQRDLLPIVEGSVVQTKFGSIKTDHILFIAAGAFHLSKPSDLIPELQGRFPLRVELESLNESVLYKILTQPKHSLLKQYEALLQTEDVELDFSDEAIKAIAQISQKANEKMEDIGARRLHTVLERVLEDISFDAENYKHQKVTIDANLVHKKLDNIVEHDEIARYIL